MQFAHSKFREEKEMRIWVFSIILVLLFMVAVCSVKSMVCDFKPLCAPDLATILVPGTIMSSTPEAAIQVSGVEAIIPKNDILSHLRPSNRRLDAKEPTASKKKTSANRGHSRGLDPMYC